MNLAQKIWSEVRTWTWGSATGHPELSRLRGLAVAFASQTDTAKDQEDAVQAVYSRLQEMSAAWEGGDYKRLNELAGKEMT